MPKLSYKCENSGALCPFALQSKVIELEAGEQPSCGVQGCSIDKLIPLSGAPVRRGKLVAGGLLVLAALGLAGYYYAGKRPSEAVVKPVPPDAVVKPDPLPPNGPTILRCAGGSPDAAKISALENKFKQGMEQAVSGKFQESLVASKNWIRLHGRS